MDIYAAPVPAWQQSNSVRLGDDRKLLRIHNRCQDSWFVICDDKKVFQVVEESLRIFDRRLDIEHHARLDLGLFIGIEYRKLMQCNAQPMTNSLDGEGQASPFHFLPALRV